MGSRLRSRFAILGLLVTVACGGTDEAVIQCGVESMSVDDILQDAERPAYDGLRDDPAELIDAVVRGIVVKHTVLAEDLSDEERNELERMSRLHAQQECTDLAIKRALAAKGNLEDVAQSRFAADPQAFSLPESFRLQMIFIPRTEPDSTLLAQKIFREVKTNPGRFAELARRHSHSETAAGGGFTKPMPGSAVHTEMRRAVGEHSGTTAPFLVDLDRGAYILRVLEFWPPVEGSYEQMAKTVRQTVGKQLLEELNREVSAAVAEEHRIEVDRELLFSPAIPSTTPVMTIDDVEYTVGEILPSLGDGDTVAGPALRPQIGAFRRRHEAILHFGCVNADAGEIDPSWVMALRLRPTADRFVEENMGAELEAYFAAHREAFYQPPEWSLDLWVFPFKSGDLYQDLKDYRDLVARVQSGDFVDPKTAAESGVFVFEDVTLSEDGLLSYEPDVLRALEDVENGVTSKVIRSRRVGAFLVVRRRSRSEAEPMNLDDSKGRKMIKAQYITDSRDEVMEAFFENSGCVIDRQLVQNCISAVSLEKPEASP